MLHKNNIATMFFQKVVFTSSSCCLLLLLCLQILMQTTSSGLSSAATVEDIVLIPVQVCVFFSSDILHHFIWPVKEVHPINLTSFFLFQILDPEISFSNLAKAKERVEECSPAMDKMKLDSQPPHDARSFECLAKKSPHFSFFKEVFDYCIHS